MNYEIPAQYQQAFNTLKTQDVPAAQAGLQELLQEFLRSSLTPKEHLGALEAIRPYIHKIQTAFTDTYLLSATSSPEQQKVTFSKVLKLWSDLGRSYIHVAKMAEMDCSLETEMPLLAQRRTQAFGAAIIESSRSHYSLPPGYWSQFHESYLEAERKEVARIRVTDALNFVWSAESAEETYVTVNLVYLTQPSSYNAIALSLIIYLAQQFAPYCKISAEKSTSQVNHIFGVDLDQNNEPRPVALLNKTGNLRYLDGGELMVALHTMRSEIRRGVIPSGLGFMAEVSHNRLLALVNAFYRPWVSGGNIQRKHPRCSGDSARLLLLNQWRAICANAVSSSNESEVVESVSSPHNSLDATVPGNLLGIESWSILDQSPEGFRLGSSVVRSTIQAKQLIAIRTENNSCFLLAQVRWVKHGVESGTEIGVRLIPGILQNIQVRSVGKEDGLQSSDQVFSDALVLSYKQQGIDNTSLILPKNLYTPDVTLEVKTNSTPNPKSVVIGKLLLSGTNFDQIECQNIM